LEIDGTMVEQVMEFNYLDVNNTSLGDLAKGIESQKLKKQQELLVV
jgi:hypothetical protein